MLVIIFYKLQHMPKFFFTKAKYQDFHVDATNLSTMNVCLQEFDWLRQCVYPILALVHAIFKPTSFPDL